MQLKQQRGGRLRPETGRTSEQSCRGLDYGFRDLGLDYGFRIQGLKVGIQGLKFGVSASWAYDSSGVGPQI